MGRKISHLGMCVRTHKGSNRRGAIRKQEKLTAKEPREEAKKLTKKTFMTFYEDFRDNISMIVRCDHYEDMEAENKRLREDKKTLRRIEGTLKLWASVINPDYRKICIQIIQALNPKTESE